MCRETKIIYIDIAQFYFLLGGCGIDEIYGLTPKNFEKVLDGFNNRECVLQTMFDLYKWQYVEWENGKLIIKEPLLTIVQTLKNSTWCMEYINDQGKNIVYVGSKCVQITVSKNDSNRFMCTIFPQESLYHEMGIEKCICLSLYPENMEDRLSVEKSILNITIRNTINGEIIKIIFIIVDGIYSLVRYAENEKNMTMDLSTESMDNLLFGGE